ncbi:hypothetical protein, partial [Maribacter algicola]|uniref:hypothetical protein n=1 Tax=Maribacter algicola TaxID=2498892 RepID=UPI001A9D8115
AQRFAKRVQIYDCFVTRQLFGKKKKLFFRPNGKTKNINERSHHVLPNAAKKKLQRLTGCKCMTVF